MPLQLPLHLGAACVKSFQGGFSSLATSTALGVLEFFGLLARRDGVFTAGTTGSSLHTVAQQQFVQSGLLTALTNLITSTAEGLQANTATAGVSSSSDTKPMFGLKYADLPGQLLDQWRFLCLL